VRGLEAAVQRGQPAAQLLAPSIFGQAWWLGGRGWCCWYCWQWGARAVCEHSRGQPARKEAGNKQRIMHGASWLVWLPALLRVIQVWSSSCRAPPCSWPLSSVPACQPQQHSTLLVSVSRQIYILYYGRRLGAAPAASDHPGYSHATVQPHCCGFGRAGGGICCIGRFPIPHPSSTLLSVHGARVRHVWLRPACDLCFCHWYPLCHSGGGCGCAHGRSRAQLPARLPGWI